MYEDKSFRASSTKYWNALPNIIKLAASKEIFCKVLKILFLIFHKSTYLYAKHVCAILGRIGFNSNFNVMHHRTIPFNYGVI